MASNLKTLDRHLKEAFKSEKASSQEDLPKSSEYMWKLFDQIQDLYTDPPMRISVNGNPYYSRGYRKKIRILAEMHPLLKEELVNAVKNSKLNRGQNLTPTELNWRVENFPSYITSPECIQLIGKLGKALSDIRPKRAKMGG